MIGPRLRYQTCVLTTLPTVDAPSSLLANACKKPLSDADPLSPPSVLTRASKLVCSDVSAELSVLLLADAVLDEPDSD